MRRSDTKISKNKNKIYIYISMGESNTVVSAYTLHKHLQQYCSHPIELCNDSSDPAILRKLNVPNIGDPRSRGRGSLLGLGLSLSLSLSLSLLNKV